MDLLSELNKNIKKTIFYSVACLIIILIFLFLFVFVYNDDIANDFLILACGIFIVLSFNSLLQLIIDIFIRHSIRKEIKKYNYKKINAFYFTAFLITILPIGIYILISPMISSWLITIPLIFIIISLIDLLFIKDVGNNRLFILILISLFSFPVLLLINNTYNNQLTPKIQIERIFSQQNISQEYIDKCYNGVLASCLKKDVYLNSADKFYYYYYYDFTTNLKNALNRVKQTNIKTEYEFFSLDDNTTLYYLYDNKQGRDFTKNIYIIETQNSIISFVTNAEILPLRFKELIIGN